jgi:hypothetical protein
VTLTLVPSPQYFLRDDRQEIRVDLQAVLHADAGQLPRQDSPVTTRGSEGITFQRDLFAVPFGRAYFEGFRSAPQPEPARLVTPHQPGMSAGRWAAIASAGVAASALAVGIGFGAHASALASDYRGAIGVGGTVEQIKADSEAASTTANVFLGVGAAAAAGATVLWLLSE